MRGILKGVGDVIDNALHLKFGKHPRYERKSNCRQLSGNPIYDLNFEAFVSEIYNQLELNCAERLPEIRQGGKPPGPENWRWKPLTNFASREKRGLEVPFERLIATISTLPNTDEFNLRSWTNQMPVASGLTNEKEGGRRIDLVHRCPGGSAYDFIELKTSGPDDNDNPLHAAMEILIYGLVYVYSRAHREDLNYTSNQDPFKPNVLADDTKTINLRVVTPERFYRQKTGTGADEKYDLQWLEDAIDSGLASFLKVSSPVAGLIMTFRFEEIKSNFIRAIGDHGFVVEFDPQPVNWKEPAVMSR